MGIQPRRSDGDYGSPESLTVPCSWASAGIPSTSRAPARARRARHPPGNARLDGDPRPRLEETRLEMLVRHAIRAQDENRSLNHDGCIRARVNRSHAFSASNTASGCGAAPRQLRFCVANPQPGRCNSAAAIAQSDRPPRIALGPCSELEVCGGSRSALRKWLSMS